MKVCQAKIRLSVVLAVYLLLPVILLGGVRLSWDKIHSSAPGDDNAQALVVDKSYVYITGKDVTSSSEDITTLKCNSNGDIVWTNTLNIPATNDAGVAMAMDSSGNIYVAGYKGADWFIVKYNALSGETLWTRTYNGPGDSTDVAVKVLCDNGGNVYVTGYSIGAGTSYDFLTIKYDSNGDTVWVRRYNGPDNGDDRATAITIDNDGNVYVTGYSIGAGTSYDFLTIKYDSNGDTVWVRRYNGPVNGDDRANAITVDGSGNVYVTGYRYSNSYNKDLFTIKYNSLGDTVWTRLYHWMYWMGYYTPEFGRAIFTDAGNNIYVLGTAVDVANSNNENILIIKYSPSGDLRWLINYNGYYYFSDCFGGAVVTENGNIYIASYQQGIGWWAKDSFAAIKYDSSGNLRWVKKHLANYGGGYSAIGITRDSGSVYVCGTKNLGGFSLWRYYTVKYSEIPEILIVPPRFQIAMPKGETKDTTMRLYNTGDWILNWNLTKVPDVSWLSVDQTSGAINASESMDVSITLNTSGLDFGVYACTLRITSNDSVNPIVDIPIELSVLRPPEISVTPTSFNITLVRNTSKDTILSISNSGELPLSWSLTEIPNDVDWLSEYPTAGEIPASGNSNLTVSFDATGLEAGVYACTLRISSNDPENPIVDVPVELTVILRPPEISVTPLSFNLTMAGGAFLDTIIRISNSGNEVLTCSLSIEPPEWWIWLNTDYVEISEMTYLDVPIYTSELYYWGSPYECNIIIRSNDPNDPVVEIPVTINIIPPEISVEPTSFNFTLYRGQTKDTTFQLVNLGTEGVDFDIYTEPYSEWIDLAYYGGWLEPQQELINGLSIYTGWLSTGTHRCTLRVWYYGQMFHEDIIVEVNILPTPQISISPSNFNIVLPQNVTKDTTLTISNTGDASLSWNLAEIPNASWLTEYPTTGEMPASGNSDVTVSFNTFGMTPGVYNTTLRFSSNDPLNPVVDVPVALTVTGPVISVSPSSFSLTLGQNVTKDTTLTISNLGNATLSWSLSEVPQVDWLTEYPTSGEIPGLDETNVTLSVNTEWLLPGVYSCTLRLSSNDPLNPVVDVPVALTVTGPVISVSPSSFSLTLGQNVTKDTTLVIYNQGNATLSWSLAETPTVDWLTEYPTTGEIPASGNSDVTVSFNTFGMTPGVYNTTLRLSSNDPLNPVVDVSVTLTISGTQRPIISVVPSSIVVVLDKGLSKDTTLTIRNLGNVMLTWNLEELSEVNWLSEDPTSGEIFPDSSVNITISFTTTGLVSWDYHCILKITSNDPGNPEVNVPITLIIPGWVRRTNIPSKMQHKLRFVRNGGAVVGVNDTMIYAFRGNRSNEFYAYLISQDSWVAKESIRFGYKPEDTTQINKKKVNRGAALCYDGDSLIYAIKGGNTRELWVYDIRNDFWMLRSFVPIRRNLKGGSALAYRNGRVYLLAGGQKTEDKNFLAYNVNTNTWDTLKSPPLIPDNKKFRDGSSIAIIGDTIYCLKGGGRHNYFWLYEIANDTWILKETIPLRHSMLTDKRNKANKVKDGAAITTDGKTIFAIKGGGKQDFWQYLPQVDRWIPQDTVPRLPESKKSVPKNGAALTYADGKVWLLKGNNTPEFWSYTIGIVPNVNVNIMTHNSQKIHASNVALLYQNYPNPFMTQTAISYILPVPTYASLAIYDASGRLVKTLVKGLIQPGRHTVKWDGTDEYGKKVNPGIYFYTLQTAQGKIARKLVILD